MDAQIPHPEQIHGFVGGGAAGDFAHYGFHGYYALDWTMVDANFGTAAEFREMTEAAHDRGIRIILDVVMNHTGYNTVADMAEFGFGKLSGIDGSWQPKTDERYDAYHQMIDYSDETAWASWWGRDWIRAGLPGYDRGGSDDYTMSLAGLPDIKTESQAAADIPPILKTKWSGRQSRLKTCGFDAIALCAGSDLTPTRCWRNGWLPGLRVRIDLPHQYGQARQMPVWKQAEASQALKIAPGSSGWPRRVDGRLLHGGAWGQGTERNAYYDNGFDAMINFTFQGNSGYNGPVCNWKPWPMSLKPMRSSDAE